MYGFRFDQAPDGFRCVRQVNGEDLPPSYQSSYRFGSWQEARDAGVEWQRQALERANARAYAARVRELEAEGMTTSDAQSVLEAEARS
jgi:hypothetical protein